VIGLKGWVISCRIMNLLKSFLHFLQKLPEGHVEHPGTNSYQQEQEIQDEEPEDDENNEHLCVVFAKVKSSKLLRIKSI